MLSLVLSLLSVPQTPVAQRWEVELAPQAPSPGKSISWSPKGAKVDLTADGDSLVGSFALGGQGTPPVLVRLSRSAGATHYDTLAIDSNRDGVLAAAETKTCTPKEQRGKWWSSFEATLQVPIPGTAAGREPGSSFPYPMSLWFVFDPAEPEAAPALRWSRRGWHQGAVEIDGKQVLVLITEAQMDGVFTTADSWALAADEKQLLTAASRSIDKHCWLAERAFRIAKLDPAGQRLWLEPCEPELSAAEEKARADTTRVDREAPRAEQPLQFGADFAAAMAQAAKEQKRVFVDFATTWCGPCKQMDQWVYTAAAVVEAGKQTICVKLDGDVERELVKRFGISGYPTMLLLDADGKEVRRLVGYRGVAAMTSFFAP